MSILDRILGPRVTREERAIHGERYRIPTFLFAGAALLLMVSLLLPYWVLNMQAPQFPDGLTVWAYVNRLQGDDLVELEGLNHYVGLRSFEDGAVFERSIALAAMLVLIGLVLAGLFIHSRWVVLFVAPALFFPLIFVADLQYWLWVYGHNLDPAAPLANAVGEFTPPIFGPAKIAQFDTMALPGLGFILAVVASLTVGVGLWFHRKAYKPLIDGAGEEATR